MPISLGALSLDPTAPSDLARDEASRAVNAEQVRVEIGPWRRTYDGVAAPFLLSSIYGATVAALLDGASFDFFCLDDLDGGRVIPASPGRVRVLLRSGEEHELSGFEVVRASVDAITQVAEFLAANDHPEGAAILIKEIARRPRPSGAGHAVETV